MRQHRMFAIGFLVMNSCTAQQEFKGSSNQAPATLPPASAVPPTVVPNAQVPTIPIPDENCGPHGTTIASLSPSSELSSGQPQQFIHYSVSVADCYGSVLATENSILFDIDAFWESAAPPAFTVTDPTTGASLLTGEHRFTRVNGTDLFGHIGLWSHYKTDAPLQLTQARSHINLTIDMSGIILTPRVGPVDGTSDIFLRFGQATANKQQIRIHGTPLPSLSPPEDDDLGNGSDIP